MTNVPARAPSGRGEALRQSERPASDRTAAGRFHAADSDLTDAHMRAQGRYKSAKVLPPYAKRTMKLVA
jgi:hypothetical protein